MNNIGLYIHVPFCLYKCAYCDFYSLKYEGELAEAYVNSVCREIQVLSKKYRRIVDTIYFGGGTPTLLAEGIIRIIDIVKKYFRCELKEITVEANPKNDLSPLLHIYAQNGVNRLSFGAQTANREELKRLTRNHAKEDIIKSVYDAKNAGIKNISLDLMLGISQQTKKSLHDTMIFYNELNPTHISGYILKIEENTKYHQVRGRLSLPNDDEVSNLYFKMVEALSAFGYEHYEISNFAKPGFQSVHNLKYWQLEEYIGIGPSAHSFIDGKRYYYENSLEKFLSSPKMVFDALGGDLSEKIMLSLRLSKGLDLTLLDLSVKTKLLNSLNRIPKEYINLDSNRLRITKDGFLLSNYIIATILEGIG